MVASRMTPGLISNMVSGAVVGMAGNAATQVSATLLGLRDWKDFDVTQVLVAGLGGAAGGALGWGATRMFFRNGVLNCEYARSMVLRHTLAGAVGGAVVDAADQLVRTGSIDPGRVLTASLMGAAQGFVTGRAMRGAYGACFTWETPIITKRGRIPFVELREDDYVLSAPENDPFATPQWRRVEELFRTTAFVWHLHVKGRLIRTTAEHPFYVWGKGWVPARLLQAGDVFRSDDGRMIELDDVCEGGYEEVVYNCRVEEYHTYFVGGEEWGFSVWAHNRCRFHRVSSQGKTVFGAGIQERRNFERIRRANLDPPNNFPVIDRINRATRTGTSHKTIDLTSARANDPARFRSLIRGYIDDLRRFDGGVRRFSSALDDFVAVPSLRNRRLEIGVQDGLLQNWQRRILQQEGRRAGRLSRPVDLHVYSLY